MLTFTERALGRRLRSSPSARASFSLLQVQIDVIKNWMSERIPELMGMEDEVVCVYAHAQLEECATNIDQPFCPKKMQIYMTGFMGEAVGPFMKELQNLLLAAQEDPRGIPPQLVREKQSEKDKKLQAIEEAKKKIAMLQKLQGQTTQVEKAVERRQDERRPRPRSNSFSDSDRSDQRRHRERPETRKRYRSRSYSSDSLSDDRRRRRSRHHKDRRRRRRRSPSRSESSGRRSRSDDSRDHRSSSRREKRSSRRSGKSYRDYEDRDRRRHHRSSRKDKRRRRSSSRSSQESRRGEPSRTFKKADFDDSDRRAEAPVKK